MKRTLVFVFAVFTLFGCEKSNEEDMKFNYDNGIKFSVVDSQNKDLLNPEHPNHINEADIKLFYLVDGELQEFYDPNLDSPKNIRVSKHENEYRIGIGLNYSETSDKPVTYIQWNDNDTDTVEVIYARNKNGILKEKIWLNGEFVWERGDNTTDAYFELKK